MGRETEEIIMAGFGGQGVLFLGKVIAETGMVLDRHVSWMPSYGPEMRGGTANCTVVVSKQPIASPIVNEPDTLIALNGPSLDRFESTIKPNGILIYNSSLIKDREMRKDIKVCPIPANDLAAEIGNDKIGNLVLAGVYARFSEMMNFDDLSKALQGYAKKKEMLEMNLAALKKGYDYAADM